MADFAIDFEWPRSKYELRTEPTLPDIKEEWPWHDSDRRLGRIVAVGKPTLARPTVKALNHSIELLLRVARVAGTGKNKALLGFETTRENERDAYNLIRSQLQKIVPKIANSLGMLNSKSKAGDHEPLNNWFLLAQALKLMFDFKHDQWMAEMEGVGAEYRVYLVPKGNEISLAVRPPSLWSAIMIHAMQSIAGGTRFSSCEQCSAPFLSGGGRGATKRKAGTRFCSEQCRWDFNNERRKA